MRSQSTGITMVTGAAILASFLTASAAPPSESFKSRVDDDGTLHVQGETIPYSDLASPESKRAFVEYVRGFESLEQPLKPGQSPPSIQALRERIDRMLMIPGVARLRKAFAVDITPEKIGGVQTDVVVPKEKIAPQNTNRVLINLHGGGWKLGARFGGQMESIPIASLGAIKVITVDFREAPEWHFPAASEDVTKVYRELLKSYRPENIGIYGCSSGSVLTAQSVAWFQAHGLPRPGAIGLFGQGALSGDGRFGDANYIFKGGKPEIEPGRPRSPDAYEAGADPADPLVSPARSSAVLKGFPPSLLLSGTRDIGLSTVLYTHEQLVALGMDSELHVWEGAPHCSIAQPVVDPDVPETRQAWAVTVRFFDKHLGTKPR